MHKILFIFAAIFLLCEGLAYSVNLDDISIHGFVSSGYLKSDHNNYLLSSKDGSFEFNEVGINFSAIMNDNIRIGLQLYSFDMGNIGNNKVELDWAFIDYQWKEELGIRVGKVKTPYGLYNEEQDYDMLHVPILLPQCIYNKVQRETIVSIQGFDIYGNVDLKKTGSLNYDVFAGAMNVHSDGALARRVSRDGMIFDNWTFDPAVGNRIKWNTPLDGLILASTFILVDNTLSLNSKDGAMKTRTRQPNLLISIFSTEYSYRNLKVAAEYYKGTGSITTTIDLSASGQPAPAPIKTDKNLESYYASISCQINNRLSAGAYYSVYYKDKKDRHGQLQVARGKPDYNAWQKDLAFSLCCNFNEFWLLKLEVHFINGVGLTSELDNPDGYEKDWMLFGAKTTFNF